MSTVALCQVCLASNTKMHHIANTPYQEIFEKLATELCTAHGRPDTVCWVCLSALRRGRWLADTARAAHEILTQLSLSGIQLNEDTLSILDRNLVPKLAWTAIQTQSIYKGYEHSPTKVEIKQEPSENDLTSLELEPCDETQLLDQPQAEMNNTQVLLMLRHTEMDLAQEKQTGVQEVHTGCQTIFNIKPEPLSYDEVSERNCSDNNFSEIQTGKTDDVEKFTRKKERSEKVGMVVVPKKKKKVDVKWRFVQKFDNRDKAEVVVKTGGTWSLHYYHQTEEGKKKYYRCNKLKRRGPQCSAKMYLLFESTSDSVLMYKTIAGHDHGEKTDTSPFGLSDALKVEINKLFKLKMKPKAIMQHLSLMTHIKLPKMSQLRNYLSDRRQAVYGQPSISLGELEAWILSLTTPPLDPHKVFVISHQIDASDEMNPAFRFAISTRYLIKIARDVSVVHLDATYKIIWQGFPVLVCGTTDQNRKFHPLCLAVTSNEQKEDFKVIFEGLQKRIQECCESTWFPKVLVSDAAKSIQNAFLEVFGDNVVIRMCWAHVKKNIHERVQKIYDTELRTEILSDVDVLHSITSPNIFDAASEAFLQKYKDQIELIKYFREQWLVQNRNWFLGAAPNSPSTNNALESFNRVIKDSDTVRQRFPLSRFLVGATEMVNNWSTKYMTNPEENDVAKIPSLSLKNWTESYQWAKMIKKVTVLHTDDHHTHYQIPAGKAKICEVFEKQWESFNDFKKQNFSKWVISMPIEKDHWRQGKCNCPSFYKMYICKHVIGLAIRLKYVAPPPEAKNIQIGEKRKRGRPLKAKKALIRQ